MSEEIRHSLTIDNPEVIWGRAWKEGRLTLEETPIGDHFLDLSYTTLFLKNISGAGWQIKTLLLLSSKASEQDYTPERIASIGKALHEKGWQTELKNEGDFRVLKVIKWGEKDKITEWYNVYFNLASKAIPGRKYLSFEAAKEIWTRDDFLAMFDSYINFSEELLPILYQEAQVQPGAVEGEDRLQGQQDFLNAMLKLRICNPELFERASEVVSSANGGSTELLMGLLNLLLSSGKTDLEVRTKLLEDWIELRDEFLERIKSNPQVARQLKLQTAELLSSHLKLGKPPSREECSPLDALLQELENPQYLADGNEAVCIDPIKV